MFAQANSEHCRHKIFNASSPSTAWRRTKSLFGMIRNTHQLAPQHTVVAYCRQRLHHGRPPGRAFVAKWPLALMDQARSYQKKKRNAACADEGGNAQPPTAISPFPAPPPGAGGEIRDEGATGRAPSPRRASRASPCPSSGAAPWASLSTLPARCRSWSKGRWAARRSTTSSAAPT